MKKLFLTTIILMFTNLGFAASEVVTVKGMVCAFCAQGITKKFTAQPEVEKVDVSLENKKVSLTYKEGRSLSHEKIEKILKDAGYEAVFANVDGKADTKGDAK